VGASKGGKALDSKGHSIHLRQDEPGNKVKMANGKQKTRRRKITTEKIKFCISPLIVYYLGEKIRGQKKRGGGGSRVWDTSK